MSEILETIKTRRSIRNFEDKAIPDEWMNTVLEAVRWTPSWANTQCWELIVVKDRAAKQSLQGIVGKGNPATRSIVEAPVVIGVCGKLQRSGYYKGQVTTKFGDWFMFDLGLATQSLCLTAHQIGLGTVIVGLFDHDRARDILQVPEGYEIVALVPMGFPARGTGAPKRREIGDFVHYEKF